MVDPKQYRSDIDVLRAIAVVPVVLFHLGTGWIDGGYLGVDVFFVISGFLITRIIVSEVREDRFSYRKFFARRIRRILPALLAVVFAVLVIANVSSNADQISYVARQSLTALGSIANVYFWVVTGDYWGPSAETTELLHTWSLSVEEQFYVLFPFAICVSMRAGKRWLPVFLWMTLCTSLALFFFGVILYPRATFYLLPFRAWELASGAILATWMIRRQSDTGAGEGDPTTNRSRDISERGYGAVIGLGLIGFAYFSTSGTRSVDINAIAAVLGAVLFIANPGIEGPCSLLNRGPLIYLGKISYSLYLWHWPVILFWKRSFGEMNVPAVLLVSLAMAILSYHAIEQTTRRRAGVVPWIGLTFLIVAGFAGVTAYVNRRIVIDMSEYATPVWHGAFYSVSPDVEPSSWFRYVTEGVEVPERQAPLDAIYNGGIQFGPGEDPEVVLLGDSHATMWANQVREVIERKEVRGAIWAVNGLAPGFGSGQGTGVRAGYDRARKELISLWKPKVILISTRWSQVNFLEVEHLIDFASQQADHVLLIEEVPNVPVGDQNLIRFLSLEGIAPEEGKRQFLPLAGGKQLAEARQKLHVLAGKHENVQIVAMFDHFNENEQVCVLDGDQAVYLDDDHLTEYGTGLAVDRIESALLPLLNDSSGM